MTPESGVRARKVLCVDDDLTILSGFQRNLRKEFEITGALGGAAALKTISEKGPFAVIVSDLQMPGMTGLEFLAKAREIAPESTRIVLSGKADMQTVIQAANEGIVYRFLTKPCPPETLAATVRSAIAQYELTIAGGAPMDEGRLDQLRKDAAVGTTSPPVIATPYVVQSVDPATGLPDWRDAEATMAAFRGKEPSAWVVLVVAQRMELIASRYGAAVRDRIMLSASQRMISWLDDASARLFRWKGASFLAVINSNKGPGSIKSGIQAGAAGWQNEYIESQMHNAYIPIKIAVEVFSLEQGAPTAQMDKFLASSFR